MASASSPAARASASRAAQGLGPTIADLEALEVVAVAVRRGADPDYWRRRAQALAGSPTVRFAQNREDISGSGRVHDPRWAA